MPSKVVIMVIKSMFLGINMFFAFLRVIFLTLAKRLGLKWLWVKPKTYLRPRKENYTWARVDMEFLYRQPCIILFIL